MVVERRRAHADRARDRGQRDARRGPSASASSAAAATTAAVLRPARRPTRAPPRPRRRPRARARRARSRGPSRRPGSSTTGPWPTARRAGSSARRARALRSAVGRCQVDRAGNGKRGLIRAVVATPPSVENASPAISVRSRVSRKAMCPGVWPGAAMTSSDPTRSPGDERRAWRVPRTSGQPPRELGLRLVGVERVVAGEQARLARRGRTSTPASASTQRRRASRRGRRGRG